MPGKIKQNQGIQVISRATEILRTLASDTRGMSLGGIANEVNLPRSTVQRIVSSLAEEGLVSVGAANSGIRLGPEIQRLARSFVGSPRDHFRPVLEKVAKETGETVDLAVLRDGKMRFIDQIEGSQRLRTVSAIGDTFPLMSTANGKAALACLDEFEATKLLMDELADVPPQERRLAALLDEISAIRGGALACDNGEHTEGISALGFAVADASGDIFSISLPVPTSRFELRKPTLIGAMEKARQSCAGTPAG